MEFLQFILLGLGVGGAYALVGQGLVLVYRGSAVVNLSQAAIGGVGAYAFLELKQVGWSTLPAALGGIAGSVLVGVLFAVLVMRRLRNASPLSRLIATIGLLTTLISIANLRYPTGQPNFAPEAILPDQVVHIFGTSVGLDRLLLLAIAVALTAALWAIYRFTRFGLATTAVAENERMAAALGVRPQRIALINWAAGSALAGFAGVMLSPILSLTVSQLSMMIMPALAAAMIGRFRSFPITLAGGLLVGVIQSEMERYVTATGWSEAAPFLLIIVFLAIRGTGLPLRSHLLERLPAIGSGRLSPRLLLPALVVTVLVMAQMDDLWVNSMTATLTFATVALSVVVVTGYAGQLSLVQLGLAGMGALVAARLNATLDIPFLAAGALGVLATIPIGLVVALPALRTRGVNLAIVTLGFSLALEQVVFNNVNWTGGPQGTIVSSPSLFGFSIDPILHSHRYAYFSLAVFAIIALVVTNVRRGRSGRRLIAVRSNERAAAALGISVVRTKLYAFGLGAAIAAVGGVVMAFQQTSVLFSQFSSFGSLTTVVLTVIGGVGFVMGAPLGAVIAIGAIGTRITSNVLGIEEYVPLAGGLLLMFNLIVFPDGLASKPPPIPGLGWVLARLRSRPPADRPAAERASEGRGTVTPMVLQAHGIGVSFGGITALSDVAVEISAGQIVGVIGPNGAGKTTLIDALSGFVADCEGQVRLGDQEMDRWSVSRRANAGLGRSFQSGELFDEMTVRENLLAACEPRDSVAYLTDLAVPGRPPLSPAALAAIDEFGLADVLDVLPTTLSAGRRRLVSIARAVAAKPSVLLLDEPAAGLDEEETRELGDLLRRLSGEWGMAIMLVEHDMSLVMTVCDRVLVLDHGRQIAEGPPDAVQDDPLVVEAYLGAPVLASMGASEGSA